MAGVKSVERLQILLAAGTASNSASLTKSQTVANCVPFATKHITTIASPVDNWSQQAVDISFSGSTVVAATNDGSTRAITVEVTVVEFDPALVDVQQGTFTMTASASDAPTLGTTLGAVTATAMVHYWQNTGAPAVSEPAMVRGVITNTTTVTFTRGASTGNCTGHYYTFEALSSQFVVDQVNIALTGAASNTGTIGAVTMAKTFLIGSYEGTSISDDNTLGSCDITLTNTTTITVQRNGSTGNITANVFAIEFAAGGSENVYRGTISAQGATASQDVDHTAVDLDLAMPWIPSATSHKTGSFPGAGSSDNSDAQCSINMVDTDTVNIEHSTAGGEASNDISWEVVEWEIVTATREQHSFRFKKDTGAETSTDWQAALNTNITLAKNTNIRPRVLGNMTGDPPTEAATLEYKEDADAAGEWRPVPVP
jgi:hypothetical protein